MVQNKAKRNKRRLTQLLELPAKDSFSVIAIEMISENEKVIFTFHSLF